MTLREQLHRICVGVVPRDGTGAEATHRSQIAANRRTFGTGLHPRTGVIGQPYAVDLVKTEVSKSSLHLSEARPVLSLRRWHQRRRVVGIEPFQRLLVRAARLPSPIRPLIFSLKLGKELLGDRFG